MALKLQNTSKPEGHSLEILEKIAQFIGLNEIKGKFQKSGNEEISTKFSKSENFEKIFEKILENFDENLALEGEAGVEIEM